MNDWRTVVDLRFIAVLFLWMKGTPVRRVLSVAGVSSEGRTLARRVLSGAGASSGAGF